MPGKLPWPEVPPPAFLRRGLLTMAGAGAATILAGCDRRSPTDQRTSPSPSAAATKSFGARPSTPSPPRWSALADRLSGQLLRPGDPGYDVYRLTANPRYDEIRPAAIARCRSAKDVQATLRFAREGGLEFTVRSGGHCYGGWSTGSGLVLDVSAMSAIEVGRAADQATVAAGARLIDVYRRLGDAGVGVPAGSCPSVGMAGLTLGGGIGVLARSWGLTCDNVAAFQMVTADGTLHQVDDRRDPDLFWAGRGGGGGSLGVVTSFTLRTRAAPAITIFFLRWPWSAAATVVDAWQHWGPVTDRRAWSTCKLLTTPTTPRVLVAGTWTGPPSGLDAVLAPMLAGAGVAPVTRSARRHTYLDAMLTEANCRTDSSCHLPPVGTLGREFEAATSHMPTALIPGSGIRDLVAAVERMARAPGLVEAGASLDALGGVVTETAAADSAFAHRGSPFSVQYTATWAGQHKPAGFDTLVRDARATMTPHLGNGAYVNYPDAALADWQRAYYGNNYPRLQDVKRRVDPDDVFRFAQSIRT